MRSDLVETLRRFETNKSQPKILRRFPPTSCGLRWADPTFSLQPRTLRRFETFARFRNGAGVINAELEVQ